MKQTFSITRKELNSYFSSPMALIFVGVFLAVTLFTFFWVDEFFARGIADLRPLFRWMPVLMIFLVAALTMRQWSEEQQNGTLEMLLTMPMQLVQLVLGKFLAVLVLVALALLLTVFLPVTISFFGNPDAGPIIGGYLAALLMASAYIAIGLFVSSRTANQIVSLIVTALICGLFQLVGSNQITGLFSSDTGEILRALGTGSRFESIERGVVDLRDLAYYLSLTGIFLVLNVVSLDMKRWGKGISAQAYRFNTQLTAALLAVNLIAFNAIIFPFHSARLDLTQDRAYSLSDATKDLLENLQEPLLIRGYFSEKNHPLLSPLIPRVRDVLDEYRIAADGKLDLEIVDPIEDPDKEAEANQTYGISPTPLQTTDRYGASVINVYFDILIRYGDQTVTLNFRDLIDIDEYGNGDYDVRLRNLEYDLTRSIKKVVFGFQSVDAVLASLGEPARLTLYYTPDTLPESLMEAPTTIDAVAQKIVDISNGKFIYQSVNVNDPASGIDPQQLYNQYGIQPIAQSFLSPDTYYLHMVLTAGDKAQLIYASGAISEAEIRNAIEGALQRAAPGFLKVVGLWVPPEQQQMDMFGQAVPTLQTFQTVNQSLRENYEVQTVDLSSGEVPANLDILFLIGPENLTDIERYAADQYLMRGGTVFVAAGNYKLALDTMSGSLTVQPMVGGLQEMLTSYGVTVEQSMVMDTQNSPFPVTVSRNAGGVMIQEIQAINYPFFVNVRPGGMDRENPILATLPSLTMTWVSPVTVDQEKNKDREVTVLMSSTGDSWTRTNTDIQPNLQVYPDQGFAVEGEQKSYPLAVVVEGTFDSFFKDKASPFDAAAATATETATGQPAPVQAPAAGPIESSPNTARLIIVGSSEFLNDTVFQISSSFDQESYLNALQFVQNVVDWATEDTDLLSIRSRGASARLLDPLSDEDQTFWEALNYGLALVSLIILGVLWQWRKRVEKPMALVLADTPQEVVDHE